MTNQQEPAPSSQSLLFADSEVNAVRPADGNIQILFSAAHVLRDDRTNIGRPLEGFVGNVALILSNAKPNQDTDEFIGRISSGRILMNSQWLPQAPLPCTLPGSIKLELTFANQSCLEIEAEGFECRFMGKPNFFESMAC